MEKFGVLPAKYKVEFKRDKISSFVQVLKKGDGRPQPLAKYINDEWELQAAIWTSYGTGKTERELMQELED